MSELLAVLDVGSNTIRLLVGRPDNGVVDRVLDQSEFVRLGRGVDSAGALQADRMDAASAAIAELTEKARELGVADVTAIATSAVRDAGNGREFVERVHRETGVRIEIISGEREAQLTFRGATIGVDLSGGVIVCDLGGGSAELIAANDRGTLWATSTPLGSGRLSERFIHHDPPKREEIDALTASVDETLSSLPSAEARCAVFTGGTASWMGRIAGRQGNLQRLSAEEIDRVVEILLSLPAAEVSERYEVPIERAQVIPAGIPALAAIARFYHVEHVLISLSGIREGALLEAAGKG